MQLKCSFGLGLTLAAFESLVSRNQIHVVEISGWQGGAVMTAVRAGAEPTADPKHL
jgi:hypothetical protein